MRLLSREEGTSILRHFDLAFVSCAHILRNRFHGVSGHGLHR